MFFESLAECSLCMCVTRDVIDGSTSVFFRCYVFRVYCHRAEDVRRLVVYVYVM